MSKYPSDLPFNDDKSPKMIPYIIALMMYLATLSLVGSITLGRFIDNWDKAFQNGFSIELQPSELKGGDTNELLNQKKVLDLLAQYPQIMRTQVITKTSLSSTADSWLGSEEENLGLPLPTTIDVELKKNAVLDLDELTTRLNRILPGIIVKKERDWRQSIKNVADVLLWVSVLVAALIGMATVAISTFATHTGLIIYQRITEILHLVGAQNTYIARQFQSHALKSGIKAGIIATILFILTFALTTWIGYELDLPNFLSSLPLFEIVIIGICVPVCTALIMMVTARVTVLWELRNIP